MLFVTALAFAAGLYVALSIGLTVVAARLPFRVWEPTKPLPRAAVLVAARNEEAHLPRCLDALLAQDYPADRLTIVVADDHSTDGTAAVVERYRERLGAAAGDRLRCVHVPDPEGHLTGKALALHTALGACDADLLLLTDADCTPPPGWARHLAAAFDDAHVGLVCGPTWVTHRTALHRLQGLDWAFLLAHASLLAAIGRPLTAMGNNMAFRRAAYEAVGGYPALPFSVTEDYLLFRAVAERTSYRVLLPLDPAFDNATEPLDRLSEVYAQRRRWARGGLRAPPWAFGLYALTYFAHALPLIGLLLAPGPALLALAAKLGADAALLWTVLGRFGRRGLLRAFVLFEVYLFFYIVTLPAALLAAPRIRWKARRL
ncbi:MAG TPA: glycosyltransferase [Rubricoccaceae bacterium]|nr:glycosyltransferase [Rubricoccaceae bacterium]